MKLATQVLSTSVAIALEESGDADVLATAKFCKMMNDFFDCTNVRSITEHVSKRNQFIRLYTSQPSNLVITISLSHHKGISHQLYVVMLVVVMGKRSGSKSVTNQYIKERKRSVIHIFK